MAAQANSRRPLSSKEHKNNMNKYITSMAAALLLASPLTSVSAQSVEPVAFFDGAKTEYPESLTIDKEGNCYLSLVFAGKIIKVTPDGQQSDFAAIPDSWLTGIKFDRHGNLFSLGSSGVWKVDRHGTPSLFAPIPGHAFLNDLVFDHQGNLYVTDSFQYVIWKIDPQGNTQIWSADPLLQGKASIFPNQLGPNGLVFDREQRVLYVLSTSAGRVAAIPVKHDGSAGPARVVAEDDSLVGADGMTIDKRGNLYIAVNIQNRISKVTPRGKLSQLAVDGLLVAPTSLAFGRDEDEDTLYICNNGNVFFSSTPVGEGLLKLTLRDRDCPHVRGDDRD